MMANSIVENESTFGSNFTTFDDNSSNLSSEREDFLLVLVSSLTGSTAQGRNQKRALTIIEACGVQPEVLDAADPANTLVRDELCEMSGIRGVFPQFFLVQGDRTSFFADFAEVEHMNEEGTLAEWLSMELPIANQSSKLSRKIADEKGVNKTASTTASSSTTNGDQSYIFQNDSTQADIDGDRCNAESDIEYAPSSTTEDLLNMGSTVSKILGSFDKTTNVSEEESQRQEQNNESKTENDNRNMVVSVLTAASAQDEWSDPMLLDRFEDEIQALEDYLQESEEKEEGQRQDSPRADTRPVEDNGDAQPKKFQKKSEYESKVKSAARMFETKSQTQKSPISSRRITNRFIANDKRNESKHREDERKSHENKCNSMSSQSSTATTISMSPASSTSRSPERNRSNQKTAVDVIPSTAPSPKAVPYNENKNNDKEISCMDTVSTRSETEQLLQAEVEELRRKCEKLTAERYIMEGQLKEARQRNKIDEQRTNDRHDVGTIHKFQLIQATRCAICSKAFKPNPSSPNVPISSQTCGHSICRSCCHKRLSAARRHRDESTLNSSEHLRNTISRDLFMCGMGNMSHVYSPSFDEHQRLVHECESCPICSTPRGFRPGKLNTNESLCTVLELLQD